MFQRVYLFFLPYVLVETAKIVEIEKCLVCTLWKFRGAVRAGVLEITRAVPRGGGLSHSAQSLLLTGETTKKAASAAAQRSMHV
jgi:hypothetical protein